MKGPFEIAASPPLVEVWELDKTVSEKDLVAAESILAQLLMRFWARQRSEESVLVGQNPLDIRPPVSPHVPGHG